MTSDGARTRFVRAAWANVLANVAKIVVEGVAGFAFGSVALLADAAHSVGDLVASVVVLVWGDRRFADPDANHPHGHERIEPLTALFVGATIVVLGGSLLYRSIQGLLTTSEGTFSYVLLGAIAFALVSMYATYRYTVAMNASLGSTALAALAADCRNDLYTSVAALVGIVGLMADVPILDPIAGTLVSGLVVYQGISIARENLEYLAGAAPPEDLRERVRETLLAHPAVEGVHDLVVFYDGTDLEVETHVEVDGDLPLRAAHDIETELVTQTRALDSVGDVHVHLDPSGVGEWKDASDDGLDRSGGSTSPGR
ncbi:cation diffusion facilitator family transporter [Halovivax limisalsi]|uniref:cation diffusion facilitator family transporter n=1 Tax=Halovivax limisalsi TaxID=1453760 RepID=UPI001FFD4D3B|nr:cation diffusion facilitator family transporter [Halovivax limisalsi]